MRQTLSAVHPPHRNLVLPKRVVWFQPTLTVWWVLSQPMHTAPSAGEVILLPNVLDAAEQFRPLSANEQADVIGSQRPPMPEPRGYFRGRMTIRDASS